MFKKILISLVFLFIYFSVYGLNLEGIEFFTGYFKGNLSRQDKYESIPFYISFDYSLSISRLNFLKNRLNLILEPFSNYIFSPDNNIEIGSNFLLKYSFLPKGKINPYIKGGLGFCFMSQHLDEQSTQWNFLPQVGLGFNFFIKKNLAFNLEYRYRHLSNASLKKPNSGVDTDIFLLGFSYFFEG